MPQTPPPPGEPAAARNPAAAAGRRASAAWRDVAWVGFGEEPAVAGQPTWPDATAAVPVTDAPSQAGPAAAPPVPIGFPGDLPGSRAVTARPTGSVERQPTRPPAAPLFGGVGRRARLLSSQLRRLLRLAAAAATMGAVAVFAYQGGERLAGLTGAPAPAAPVRPTIALAAQSEPEPPPVASDPVGNPSGTPAEQAAYYRQRAKEGDAAAQFNLALLYSTGRGVAQDFAAAADWLREAANAGNAAAQFDLAVLYAEGRGVAADPTAAAAWYRRAAAQNYAPAEYNLAIAQAAGHGVPQDMAAAAGWYRQAAMHGLTVAMVNLAILYETGEGVTASLPQAYAWYRAAARGGDGEAERRAGELFAELSGPAKAQAVMAAAALTAIGRGAAAAKASAPATPAATPPRRNGDRSVLAPKRPGNQPPG